MATRPSVKGTIVRELVEDVNKLVETGELSQKDLEAHLPPDDIAALDEEIIISRWYDIGFYRRLSELLRDVAGDGRDAYLRQRGFARGQKLIEAGLYQQMEYLNRAKVNSAEDHDARFAAYGRDLGLFVTLAGTLLNFSRWTVAKDPEHEDRYRIEIQDALDFPDALCWGCEGVIDAMSSAHGLPDLWYWERLAPDFIVFHMKRSL